MMYQDIIDEVKIGHRFMSKSKYLIQFYGYTVFEKMIMLSFIYLWKI